MFKKKYKKHTLGKYNLQDIAECCGVTVLTIHRWKEKEGLNFKEMTLKELVGFINMRSK